ncbi:OsmC family peroxiredoxin [Nitriliruptor alkaliphilus]|uniref:OsmC family peroxiredoxin n=1 Tax=Nitriliruptor alkaliphilus TaxID=427918 RepID=UPI0009F91BDF|nr:OsmC family peroxiredoxin [Nitriliruptor alkaliphilus]
MTTSTSNATWNGDLKSGSGRMVVGDARYEGAYTFASRFEGSGDATNPEELIAAAHAGCFSMALSNILASDGHTPDEVRTEAVVTLGKVDDQAAVTEIALSTVGKVPGIDEATFAEYAQKAKDGCPISKLLAGGTAEITLQVAFES